MSRLHELITTITTSLNPKKYDILEIRPLGAAIGYYFLMVFTAFILMGVLWVPNLLTASDYVNEQFDKFNDLSVEVVYDQKEPIVITEDYPIITIDTLHDYDDIDQGILLITENKTLFRPFPFMQAQVLDDTKDLAENHDQSSIFLTIIILMMLPMAMAFAYLYFIVKFAIVILIATIIGSIFVGLLRFQIGFEQMVKVAIYASTIMVAINLLTKPFVPDVSYLDYLAFAILFILGIVKVGEFEDIIHESKKKKKEFAD